MNTVSSFCITGGTGFIGRHLIRRLSREERVPRIKILTRRSDDSGSNAALLRRFQGDLLDSRSLSGFADTGGAVIHLAYLSGRPREENISAVTHLTRLAAEAGVSRFIHVSTAAVVGRVPETTVTETTPCRPVSEYEKTKLDLERVVLENLHARCQVIIVRPTAVFGEGGRNLLKLAWDLRNDSPIKRYLRSSVLHRRRLNLVHVENVVEAICHLVSMDSNFDHPHFIVSDDDIPQNNYLDVSRILARELGVDSPHLPSVPGIRWALPGLLKLLGRATTNPNQIFSSEKLFGTGYKRPIPLESGLKRFAEWYKNQS